MSIFKNNYCPTKATDQILDPYFWYCTWSSQMFVFETKSCTDPILYHSPTVFPTPLSGKIKGTKPMNTFFYFFCQITSLWTEDTAGLSLLSPKAFNAFQATNSSVWVGFGEELPCHVRLRLVLREGKKGGMRLRSALAVSFTLGEW